MMTFRVLLLAALLLIPGALRAKPLADMAGVSPRLVIYLAKGAPNACGQGCDRWIAVEGKVDLAAAANRLYLLCVCNPHSLVGAFLPQSVGIALTSSISAQQQT